MKIFIQDFAKSKIVKQVKLANMKEKKLFLVFGSSLVFWINTIGRIVQVTA